MDVEILKIILLVVLFFLTIICGFAPVKLVSFSRKRPIHDGSSNSRQKCYKHVFSSLSCFSAGVFLATCLLDLFPDVRQNLSDVLVLYNIHTGFPVPEFVMVFGLFIILITEQIVLEVKEKSFVVTRPDKKPLLSDDRLKTTDEDALSFKSDLTISGIEDNVSRFKEPYSHIQNTDSEESFPDDISEESHHHHHQHHHHHHHHDRKISKGHSQSVLRSVLLTVALSLHSIFEGLAIGLAQKQSNILTITSAIILHKCTLSLSLGINLSNSKLAYSSIIKSLLMFSFAAPVGIGIGILIIDLWDSLTSNLIQGLLQGIACGTFLYITFFEIFPSEFNNNKGRRLCKVLFVLFGFSVVCLIMFLDSEPASPINPCPNSAVHN
ncbi:zinc transporter ZIP1-like [Argonauta hians]